MKMKVLNLFKLIFGDKPALLENIFRIRMFSKAPESRDGDS